MPQNDLNPKEWYLDERTGYLKCDHPNSVTPEQKETFLEAMKTLGTASGAAKFAGFSTRVLSVHKRLDKRFLEDYNHVLQEMGDTLEGVMYINAQQPKGTLDRFGWLRAHFPKKWGKYQEENKDVKKTVDELWAEVEKERKESK